MSNNKRVADELEACNWSGDSIGNKAIIAQAIVCLRAEQHEGEPVAFVEVTGSRPTKYCWMGATRILPVGLHKLYTHADPAEVDRLREEIQSLRKALPNSTAELVDLRAQLAERDALLKRQPSFIRALEQFEADDGTFVRLVDVLDALSASAEPEVQS